MNQPLRDTSDNLPSFTRGLLRTWAYLRTYKTRSADRKHFNQLTSTIDTIQTEYHRGIERKQDDVAQIHNVALYSLMLDYDIKTMKRLLLVCIDSGTRKFLCRQLAVLLYEATDDILRLVGGEFRQMINALPNSDTLKGELNGIVADINSFKQDNKVFLQEIRNFCGAHRDLLAINQLQRIEELSTDDVLDKAGRFLVPVNKLLPFYSQVMKAMTEKYNRKNP